MLLHFAAILLGIEAVTASPAIAKVVKCLSAAQIPQDLPNSPQFAAEIIPYNLRVNFTPIALAVPRNVPQVQTAVECAAQYGVKVNPKSGGHSYAGHSIGGEDGHLVIDLKYFDSVEFGTNNVATVGPGARLGHLALALYNQGKRAIAWHLSWVLLLLLISWSH
jgi:FAD/FMN-containing dehydrogenase